LEIEEPESEFSTIVGIEVMEERIEDEDAKDAVEVEIGNRLLRGLLEITDDDDDDDACGSFGASFDDAEGNGIVDEVSKDGRNDGGEGED